MDKKKHPMLEPAFWEKLALMSIMGYLESGVGCVVIQEPRAGMKTSDIFETIISYVPYDPDDGKTPPEALEMLDRYDPKNEVILSIVDKQGRALIQQMTAIRMGISPIEMYRKWSRLHGKGGLVPGEVVEYREAPADTASPAVATGTYVFLERQGAWMTLCRAGLDEDEVLCVTDNKVQVHADFEECFKPVMGILIELRKDAPQA